MHHVHEIKDRYHLPERREGIQNIARNLPPHVRLKLPEVRTKLVDETSKQSDPVVLMSASLKTIDAYPDEWIHVYTDGSAFKATIKAGYGVYICYPDGSSEELFDACGEFCSNYEAEVTALETAVYQLKTVFDTYPSRAQNIVIFTDSMSALQSLEGNDRSRADMAKIILDVDELMTSHNIKIVLQWIPGHSGTPGNDRADRLAKRGTTQEQPPTATTLQTAKSVVRTINKEIWLNGWAMGSTGREVYRYMASPDPNDNINHLARRDQSTIFRLRSQHIPLNRHLNRIQPQHPPMCQMCDFPYETVDHHLFECPKLDEIRKILLPPKPDKWNTLYGGKEQLVKTCRFHYMALSLRAKAQAPLDR